MYDWKKSNIIGLKCGVIQTTSFLWLRTINNNQYKYNLSFIKTFKKLYSNGGILRFYPGLLPSITVSSICKISDISIYNYCKDKEYGNFERLFIISSVSSFTKFLIIPLDTIDTFLQLEGKNTKNILLKKIKNNGISVLYHGSSLWILNKFISSYSWFYTYDYLNSNKFNFLNEIFTLNNENMKNGIVGGTSSLVSNTLTNPFRVLKIYKQGHNSNITYTESLKEINKQSNIFWLFRGLRTRLLYNCIQGAYFSILWKFFENDYI